MIIKNGFLHKNIPCNEEQDLAELDRIQKHGYNVTFFLKAGNMNEHRKNKMILCSEEELVLIENQGICEAKFFSILLNLCSNWCQIKNIYYNLILFNK